MGIALFYNWISHNSVLPKNFLIAFSQIRLRFFTYFSPEKSIWEGGVFRLTLEFSEEYPVKGMWLHGVIYNVHLEKRNNCVFRFLDSMILKSKQVIIILDSRRIHSNLTLIRIDERNQEKKWMKKWMYQITSDYQFQITTIDWVQLKKIEEGGCCLTSV